MLRPSQIQLCKIHIPIADTPMSSPPLERGPIMETQFVQPPNAESRASYQIQARDPMKVSAQQDTRCIVCGRSVDAIKKENVDNYMRSTAKDEPDYITRLKREAHLGWPKYRVIFVYPTCSVAGCRQ